MRTIWRRNNISNNRGIGCDRRLRCEGNSGAKKSGKAKESHRYTRIKLRTRGSVRRISYRFPCLSRTPCFVNAFGSTVVSSTWAKQRRNHGPPTNLDRKIQTKGKSYLVSFALAIVLIDGLSYVCSHLSRTYVRAILLTDVRVKY